MNDFHFEIEPLPQKSLVDIQRAIAKAQLVAYGLLDPLEIYYEFYTKIPGYTKMKRLTSAQKNDWQEWQMIRNSKKKI